MPIWAAHTRSFVRSLVGGNFVSLEAGKEKSECGRDEGGPDVVGSRTGSPYRDYGCYRTTENQGHIAYAHFVCRGRSIGLMNSIERLRETRIRPPLSLKRSHM